MTTNVPDLSVLERRIGIQFKNRDLLLQAMTHRSYLNEHHREKTEHNERLEFLGDAALELAVTLHLYRAVQRNEGYLTNLRAVFVRTKNLEYIARKIGLGEFIRMGYGQRRDFDTEDRSTGYILGCAFEALIGAICVDRGVGIMELFVHEFVLPKFQELLAQDLRDPKSMLQEIAQERNNVTPTYRVLQERGPDHIKHFLVGVYLGPLPGGTGRGINKKEAETAAALEALRTVFGIELLPELLP